MNRKFVDQELYVDGEWILPASFGGRMRDAWVCQTCGHDADHPGYRMFSTGNPAEPYRNEPCPDPCHLPLSFGEDDPDAK